MAKPDNRSDNVEHLQKMTQDTLQNMSKTEQYLNEFGEEIPEQEKETLLAKNERRKASVRKFRNEIKDEAHSQE